jgi:NAD(P)H-nitrite reductase large subunit
VGASRGLLWDVIVCSCRRVNADAVAAAIDDGARDIASVSESCGAGARCGGCWPTLEALLNRVAA